jgi:hypothetical protein
MYHLACGAAGLRVWAVLHCRCIFIIISLLMKAGQRRSRTHAPIPFLGELLVMVQGFSSSSCGIDVGSGMEVMWLLWDGWESKNLGAASFYGRCTYAHKKNKTKPT